MRRRDDENQEVIEPVQSRELTWDDVCCQSNGCPLPGACTDNTQGKTDRWYCRFHIDTGGAKPNEITQRLRQIYRWLMDSYQSRTVSRPEAHQQTRAAMQTYERYIRTGLDKHNPMIPQPEPEDVEVI